MPANRSAAVLGLALIATVASAAEEPLTERVGERLSHALAPHPRLLLDARGLTAIQAAADRDPRTAKLRDRVLADAALLLNAPPLERTLTGRRLLSVSRDALSRIGTLSLAWRLTGDVRFSDGARTCLRSVCAFQDFNPSHFLDVAEMTAALAIGYDWLADVLPPAEKAAIHRAILDKSLNLDVAKESWVHGTNNWNQVCHGGLTLGALAIADEDRDLATRVIARAVANVPIAMRGYAPDGAYPEGAGYWEYGTTYSSLMIAALQSAIGTDFELTQQPGFLQSADYHLHMVGPSGRVFSYSDGSERNVGPTAPAFYLAGRRGDPSLLFNELAALDRQLATPTTLKDRNANSWLLLAWSFPVPTELTPKAEHYVARGVTPVAVHRSGWTPEATFIGIKGGSPGSSHAHMDVGAFAMDALGVRWAGDLGMQNYNSLESRGINLWAINQGSQRWDVFRIGPLSHNILTVNGLPQVVSGRAEILRSTEQFTTIDATAVYAGQLAKAHRGIVLRADGSVRVQDEIVATPDGIATPPATTTRPAATRATSRPALDPPRAAGPAVVRWAMLAEADATTNGSTASLSKNGQSLSLNVVSPAGVSVKIASTVPPHDYDVANPDTRLVTFEVPLQPGQAVTLAVDLVPINSGPADLVRPPVPVTPLAEWK